MAICYQKNQTEHSIPIDILDDLCSRFIINTPPRDRENLVRICFQVELAHWFYLDYYCTDESAGLNPCAIREFAAHVFQHVPQLREHVTSLDTVLDNWREYKQSVPTYGAIMLDTDLTHVLLVQSFWTKASWGFPKGKVNEDEEPWACAAREVLEETGFDISKLINKNDYIESTIHEQISRLYIIGYIPRDTKFKPRTRNEIKACEWFLLADLPTNKKDMTPKVKMGVSPNAFFMVLPFVKRIRRWVSDRVSKVLTRRTRHGSMGDIESSSSKNKNKSISQGLQNEIHEYQQRSYSSTKHFKGHGNPNNYGNNRGYHGRHGYRYINHGDNKGNPGDTHNNHGRNHGNYPGYSHRYNQGTGYGHHQETAHGHNQRTIPRHNQGAVPRHTQGIAPSFHPQFKDRDGSGNHGNTHNNDKINNPSNPEIGHENNEGSSHGNNQQTGQHNQEIDNGNSSSTEHGSSSISGHEIAQVPVTFDQEIGDGLHQGTEHARPQGSAHGEIQEAGYGHNKDTSQEQQQESGHERNQETGSVQDQRTSHEQNQETGHGQQREPGHGQQQGAGHGHNQEIGHEHNQGSSHEHDQETGHGQQQGPGHGLQHGSGHGHNQEIGHEHNQGSSHEHYQETGHGQQQGPVYGQQHGSGHYWYYQGPGHVQRRGIGHGQHRGSGHGQHQGAGHGQHQICVHSLNQGTGYGHNQDIGHEHNQGAIPRYNQGAVSGLDRGAVPGLNRGAVPGLDQGAVPRHNHGPFPGYHQGTGHAYNPHIERCDKNGNDRNTKNNYERETNHGENQDRLCWDLGGLGHGLVPATEYCFYSAGHHGIPPNIEHKKFQIPDNRQREETGHGQNQENDHEHIQGFGLGYNQEAGNVSNQGTSHEYNPGTSHGCNPVTSHGDSHSNSPGSAAKTTSDLNSSEKEQSIAIPQLLTSQDTDSNNCSPVPIDSSPNNESQNDDFISFVAPSWANFKFDVQAILDCLT